MWNSLDFFYAKNGNHLFLFSKNPTLNAEKIYGVLFFKYFSYSRNLKNTVLNRPKMAKNTQAGISRVYLFFIKHLFDQVRS